MRKRFFLVAALATLWASAGCEMWLHHHGYWPSGAPGGPPPTANAYNPCVPCVPATSYTPANVQPSWNAPGVGSCVCPPPNH